MNKKGIDTFPLEELTALTPLDGRYRSLTQELAPYVSEYALIKNRFELEAAYLVALSDAKVIRKLNRSEQKRLVSFRDEITLDVARRVKQVESQIRHDVKSMERVFRELLKGSSLEDCIEMLHFGLTSEDIDNISYRKMLLNASEKVCIPTLNTIISELVDWAKKYKALPMLGRTHGQAAVPTTLGKEFAVFAIRLHEEVRNLKKQQLTGKLTGAVGNFNALVVAFPHVDWINFSKKFVSHVGFKPNMITTQINPYEDVIAYFQTYQRINGIILDFNQDMWRYISDNWLIQQTVQGEVGSSTMPQKVNPEDFEKSEGSLFLSDALMEGMIRKLSVSRLQRDLSNSTTIRNIGTVMAYNLFAYNSTLKGLKRIAPNEEKILSDLDSQWVILAEGIQTILRSQKVEDPYSLVSSLTQGKHITKDSLHEWINSLQVDQKIKKKLLQLKPTSYIGLAVKLTEKAIKEIQKS